MMPSRATSTAMVTPSPTLLLEPSDERDEHNDTGMVISTAKLMLKIDTKLYPSGLIAGVIAGIIAVGLIVGLLFPMSLRIISLFKKKRGNVKIEKSIILN